MKERLVSTIIPVFNRPDYIRNAVESVVAQSYELREIIIVDDGSTDSTPKVLQELATKHSELIRLYRQENAGAAAARNRGFQESQGEFIQYLDSDDELTPSKFSMQAKALIENPQAGVCYGITRRRNLATNTEQIWSRTAENIENIFPSFLMKRGWDTNSPLWRRTVCEQVGPWGNFAVNEDWEHDLRAGMAGVVPCQVQELVAIVNDHQDTRASGMTSGFTTKIVMGMYESHLSIWDKMKSKGLTDWSYLEEFSRKVFWIARLCGEHSLTTEANSALQCAQEMVSTHRSSWKLKTYGTLANLVGWQRTVRMSEWAKRCLQRREKTQ